LKPSLFDDEEEIGGKTVTAAYHSFLSTEKLDKAKLERIAENAVGGEVRVISKLLKPYKLSSIETAIKKQKPHDLTKFFGKTNIQRFSLLNKNRLK